MTQPTSLERSLIAYTNKHNLTTLDVGYRSWASAAGEPFYASMHFDDARDGEIPCSSEQGATLAEALSRTLAVANQKRAPIANVIVDALPECEA